MRDVSATVLPGMSHLTYPKERSASFSLLFLKDAASPPLPHESRTLSFLARAATAARSLRKISCPTIMSGSRAAISELSASKSSLSAASEKSRARKISKPPAPEMAAA